MPSLNPALSNLTSQVFGRLTRPCWERTYAAAVLMTAFLSFTGANGSGTLPILMRLAYWLILMIGGTVVAQAIGFMVDRCFRWKTWQEALFILASATPVISLLVWVTNACFSMEPLNVAFIVPLFLPVLVITAVMAALHLLLNQEPQQSHVFSPTHAVEQPGRDFRQRLPFKFRAADIHALSAEDHYLRVHTSAGDTLVLMRLSDAIRQLDGIEGSQIHRSWWVAKEAVADVRKAEGRFDLVLKNGVVAPVSRTYQKALKAANWF